MFRHVPATYRRPQDGTAPQTTRQRVLGALAAKSRPWLSLADIISATGASSNRAREVLRDLLLERRIKDDAAPIGLPRRYSLADDPNPDPSSLLPPTP